MVIGAENTDVIVLSALVANSVDGVLAIKRKQNIINCRALSLEEVAEIMVLLHIHKGSDTTTAVYGHGKATIFKEGITNGVRALLNAVMKS